MTITGGRVLKVKRGEDSFVVSLLSTPENVSAVMSTVHKVDCYFPLKLETRLMTLTPGKNFTATGTWHGQKLKNCTWKSEGKKRNIFSRKKYDDAKSWYVNKIFLPLLIIAVILAVLFGNR